MPRIAREIEVDAPHHITLRGNNKQLIFSDHADYWMYIELLNKYSFKYELVLLVYCLMPNHVHFIAIPKNLDSLSRTFHSVNFTYAQYFNYRYGRVGHLWQGRYYSKTLSENHLINAARYIEQNPVRAGLCETAWNWEWSSAKTHSQGQGNDLRLGNLFEIIDISCNNWEELLLEPATNPDGDRPLQKFKKQVRK